MSSNTLDICKLRELFIDRVFAPAIQAVLQHYPIMDQVLVHAQLQRFSIEFSLEFKSQLQVHNQSHYHPNNRTVKVGFNLHYTNYELSRYLCDQYIVSKRKLSTSRLGLWQSRFIASYLFGAYCPPYQSGKVDYRTIGTYTCQGTQLEFSYAEDIDPDQDYYLLPCHQDLDVVEMIARVCRERDALYKLSTEIPLVI